MSATVDPVIAEQAGEIAARAESELAALVEHLVVNETYLFRENQQLRTLIDRVVSPRCQEVSRTGRVRIWSAACSTGEEPITLAALLRERGLLDKVELVASDISARVLERAKSGVLGRRALRAINPAEHAAPNPRRGSLITSAPSASAIAPARR